MKIISSMFITIQYIEIKVKKGEGKVEPWQDLETLKLESEGISSSEGLAMTSAK